MLCVEIIHKAETAAVSLQDVMFTAMALKLQKEFVSLLSVTQAKVRAIGHIEDIKTVVKCLLKQSSTSSRTIQYYCTHINRISCIDDLFYFLVDKHFIGYLNPDILFQIAATTKDDSLHQKMKQYNEEFWKFISQPNFEQLVNVFTNHTNLQPSSIPGLPKFVVCLTDAWNQRCMSDLVEYLPFVEECKLQLDAIGLKCVIITYSVFPVYLEKLTSYLNDTKFVVKCKEVGIEFEFPKDALAKGKILEYAYNSILFI